VGVGLGLAKVTGDVEVLGRGHPHRDLTYGGVQLREGLQVLRKWVCDAGPSRLPAPFHCTIPLGRFPASLNSPVAPGGCWVLGQLPSITDRNCTLLNPLYSYEGYLREVTLWAMLLPASAVCTVPRPWLPVFLFAHMSAAACPVATLGDSLDTIVSLVV
jgi:hypothetical protein